MNIDTLNLEEVRERLREALEKSGKSMRTASIEAGAGAGYLHSILKDEKEPGIIRLAALSKALGVSLSYILYGYNVTPETEAIMSRLEGNPEKREGILKILID